MKKSVLVCTAAAMFFAAGSAYAAQNVANTSQKGSLLIWPLINVDQHAPSAHTTLVEISNDANATVHVECEYINEEKGRVNFDFDLTAKATASWDAYTLAGDHVSPPPFPSNAGNPPFPGNPARGELVCFATDPGRMFQIAWNELIGTATVIRQDVGDSQPRQAFKYNAWSFTARCAISAACPSGLAPDNNTVSQGTPGTLTLSGANAAGAYDGCPVYNIANFMPSGAQLGVTRTVDNWISVASCNQDLRETYILHRTKLDFTVWNSNENSFTGAYACVDSVESVPLGTATQPTPPIVVQASNFDYSTVGTPNARFQVSGGAHSPPCPFPTENTGILGVVQSGVALTGDPGVDQDIGNTMQTAGTFAPAGFVLWDVSIAPPAVRGAK